jgi:DTW domain-containing protein
MGHRSKKAERCVRCRMHVELCLCAEMPSLTLPTRLCLVMHCRELKKPTATGPMALSILTNSELFVHGDQERPLDLSDLGRGGRRVLVLFPDALATPLDQLDRTADQRAISLVVPDGNWRQASRVPRRVPGLQQAELVTLPEGPATTWGVRRETKPGGLATFEAIARALGLLESDAVRQEMQRYFEKMVHTTFKMRGVGPVR